MYGCCCGRCGITYGAATWGTPFLCGRCRQLEANPVVAPIVQFWDKDWFEVPPPEFFEVAS